MENRIRKPTHPGELIREDLLLETGMSQRVQYKKVTPIKLPTASPLWYCYQTYFSLSPIPFGKHF